MYLFKNQQYRNGILHIHNTDLKWLANEIGTPFYVYDEQLIEQTIKLFKNKLTFPDVELKICYSSKAFLNSYMVKLINNNGCYFDAVTKGEINMITANGVEGSKIEFQGNNKSISDLLFAKEHQVKTVIIDNIAEIDDIIKVFNDQDVEVLLRVDPLVLAKTHKYIQTSLSSKFAIPMDKIIVESILEKINNNQHIKFAGFHYHIGSQITEYTYFAKAFDNFKLFHDSLETKYQNYETLNIGGGFGVYYSSQDASYDFEQQLEYLCENLKSKLQQLPNIKTLVIEPGRSIVANAGSTIYTVGYTKHYSDKDYAFIDGGISDNIRTAMYQAKYEAALIEQKETKSKEYCVAGKLCESGDIIIEKIDLPELEGNELLIVNSTGAYCQSMESNYNKMQKLPVVFVNQENAKLTTKRQSLDQLLENDCEDLL